MVERGLASWTEGLSARERVREIATTLTKPRSVQWVKNEAQISSWQTAKDELEHLVESGQVHVTEGNNGNPKYAPNYQRRYLDELTDLLNNHTRVELHEEIASIQDQIEEWQTRFDVDSQDALEFTLTNSDLSGEEIFTRETVLRQWEHYEDNKQLLKHALELYDDARAQSQKSN
jgi:antitoxin component of MazEF toxin-antitoxin module